MPLSFKIGAAAGVFAVVVGGQSCMYRGEQNSLSQNTGEAGSTLPKAHAPYYPNSAGNIVAPPGNPGGNPSGAPPIVGGTSTEQTAWPESR